MANAGDPDQAEACVAATVERFGGLDILVNNAATNPYFGPMIDIDRSRAAKTVEVNQLGVLVVVASWPTGPGWPSTAAPSSTWLRSAASSPSRASAGTT